MAARDIGDGAIAGIITGIIIGVIMILLALIGLSALMSYIDINAVFGGLLPMAGGIAASVTAMITLLLFTAIVGLILGAIFGAVYENIPTAGAVTKGIVFMLVIWVIFGLLLPIVVGAGTRAPAGLTVASIISSLVAAIIWGALLGLTFIWVSRRAAAPGRAPIVRP
jgi:hypothetical protein